MNKKLLISIAPLVGTAALAAMSATSAACTAPACPHVYENGVQAAEAKKVREIDWGTLKLKNATLGEVECHNVFAGYTENPTGGGRAIGKVQAFFPYECVSASCTSLGGTGITETAGTQPEGKLPWNAEVIEPEPGLFRQKNGFKAPEGKNTRSKEPGQVEIKVVCEGVAEPAFFGESDPKLVNNGRGIGSFPSEEEFTPGGVSESELESELSGNGEWQGKLKREGYASQALLEVHSP